MLWTKRTPKNDYFTVALKFLFIRAEICPKISLIDHYLAFVNKPIKL